MKTKEDIAHDLTLVYLNNRYGVDVVGYINDGHGSVETNKFASVDAKKYIRKPTGEAFFGLIPRSHRVEDGLQVDQLFEDIVTEYFSALSRFLEILESRDLEKL